MPKVAYERGGVEYLVPLDAIPNTILGMLSGKKQTGY